LKNVATIGLDFAKQVLQVHGADKSGLPVLRRKLRRGEAVRFLSEIRTCLVGIEASDHSFAQPYILISARVPDDSGYFGERLTVARSQLIRAWKQRSGNLAPRYRQTVILGALQLADQILDQESNADHKYLVSFSDMRQSTPDLNLEAPKIVPTFTTIAKRCGTLSGLRNVQVHVLGTDGADKSSAYWQSVQTFWHDYFRGAGADLENYSVLRELPQGARGTH
jgi:hypothetical protein